MDEEEEMVLEVRVWGCCWKYGGSRWGYVVEDVRVSAEGFASTVDARFRVDGFC